MSLLYTVQSEGDSRGRGAVAVDDRLQVTGDM